MCSEPSWISARLRSHYRTGLERAVWITSVRMRREDRSSIVVGCQRSRSRCPGLHSLHRSAAAVPVRSFGEPYWKSGRSSHQFWRGMSLGLETFRLMISDYQIDGRRLAFQGTADDRPLEEILRRDRQQSHTARRRDQRDGHRELSISSGYDLYPVPFQIIADNSTQHARHA